MVQRGFGRNIHDGAALFPEHRGNHGAGQVIACMHVQGHHQLIGLRFGLPERLSASKSANGIDQNIELAVPGGNPVHQCPAGGLIGGIQRQEFQVRVGPTASFSASASSFLM